MKDKKLKVNNFHIIYFNAQKILSVAVCRRVFKSMQCYIDPRFGVLRFTVDCLL